MNDYTKLILAMTLIFSTSSLVQANDAEQNRGERPQRPTFESLDLNNDGGISFDEFSSHDIPHGDYQTMFNAMDTDGDGIISKEEFSNHKPPQRKKRGGE
ncbi:MAG: EF-hand domain-containing protein [Colwellia sp.]